MDINNPDMDIINKLIQYYSGLKDIDTDTLWAMFINVWNMTMVKLCWDDEGCADMLSSERTYFHNINVEDCCSEDILLPHKQISTITSAEVKLYSSSGVETIAIVNPNDYLVEGGSIWKFYMTTHLSQGICKCEDAILKIIYTAGYAEIPECFYSSLGFILTHAICNLNNCVTSDCSEDDKMAMNGYLVGREIQGENWKWAVPNNILQDTLDQNMTSGLMQLLFQYSTCKNQIKISAGSIC